MNQNQSKSQPNKLPERGVVGSSELVRRPATMQELAKELDSGDMPQASRRDLFIAMLAARDLVDYLRANTGGNADWPIEIKTDDEAVAAGLVAKLESLERLLPPNDKLCDGLGGHSQQRMVSPSNNQNRKEKTQ